MKDLTVKFINWDEDIEIPDEVIIEVDDEYTSDNIEELNEIVIDFLQEEFEVYNITYFECELEDEY